MKLFIFFTLLLSLYACGPASVKDIKKEYTFHGKVKIKENYQAVYRRVARSMSQCYPIHITNLYTEFKMGEIILSTATGLQFLIEVSAIDDTTTMVDSYSGMSIWNSRTKNTLLWATGELTDCL